MTALRCETCDSVWLPANVGGETDASGCTGCLRCDGTLLGMTDEQTRVHFDRLREVPLRKAG